MKLRPALPLISRDIIARLKPKPQFRLWHLHGLRRTAIDRASPTPP